MMYKCRCLIQLLECLLKEGEHLWWELLLPDPSVDAVVKNQIYIHPRIACGAFDQVVEPAISNPIGLSALDFRLH